MNHIKKFEAWAGDVLPIAPLNIELEYKNCKDCGKFYQVYKPKSINCKYCGSKDLVDLSEEDYYNQLQLELSPEEFHQIKKIRKKQSNIYIDLTKNQDDFIN